MRSKAIFRLVGIVASGACAVGQTDATAPRFEKDILPIFTTHCFTCHGKTSPQLGLDLRTAASTLKGSHNGPVITKGSLENSLLWQKVSSKVMPPEAFGQKLPETHIDTIRRWILAGAPSDRPGPVASKEAEEQRALFEKEIQPLLNARCVGCHGPRNPMAGLGLHSLSATLSGSVNGPVVAEGFSERSILIRKVASGNMPPKGSGPPLSEAEIQLLRRWIDKGHFADAVEPDGHLERAFTKAEAPDITEKDRQFWSFRKPVAAAVPKTAGSRRVRTPIDSFILARLEEKGLTFSPDAPDLTLMRRAYFDLIGLAPKPEEIQAYQQDTKPGAYERLIDRLLASPHYGERWGRHWLDAVGYVDTEDKDFEATRPEIAEGMWRYRDYVVKSTNDDKPWDRFLTEQLAGDELVDWRSAEKYTPEIVEALTATGYLRNNLDITNADIINLPVERYEALFKLVEKVSSSTLGLTVACARCHTHKFDPIPQRDYYRYLALFTSAYNPSNWLQPKNRFLYTVSKTEQKAIEAHNAEIDRPVGELKKSLAGVRKPYEERLFEEKLQAVPEAIRADVRSAIETPKEKRDEVQKYLAGKFDSTLKVTAAEVDTRLNAADRSTVERLESQIQTWNGYRRKLEKIQALWDVGAPPTIRLLQRGSAESPGPKVEPGFLSVISAPGKGDAVKPAAAKGETNGLRLAYAQWLTDGENPLTARVIVNRMWQHHFGVGIVATPDNFGKTGSAPTHAELLDWLAVDFMKNGWRAKRLHKMIMMSTVYRQSSQQTGDLAARARSVDPENHLLWRMNLRRLEAEALRDAVLNAGGKLNLALGGKPVLMDMGRSGLQVVSAKESPEARNRRSIYLLARRTYPLNFLGVFDYPVIDTSCARRVPSATPLQSLTMLNDQFVMENAALMAARASEMAGSAQGMEKKVEAAYTLAFSRSPSAPESKAAVEFIAAQNQLFLNANLAPAEAAERAFATFAQTLMGSNEFLYIQ